MLFEPSGFAFAAGRTPALTGQGGKRMMLLAGLLAIDTILHAVVAFRYGASGPNTPFAIFAGVDLLLLLAVYFAVPYALWATLALSVIGLVGLTVTFNNPQREKTLDGIIWVVDLLVVLDALYLLFFHAAPVAPA